MRATRGMTMHGKSMLVAAVAATLMTFAPAAMAQQGQLNVICPVQADWCNMIRTVFSKSWLIAQKVSVLQVKTVAARSANEAYWETGEFFKRTGFQPLEVFPELWSVNNRCLQLVKLLVGG